jgi:hypothetical protein
MKRPVSTPILSQLFQYWVDRVRVALAKGVAFAIARDELDTSASASIWKEERGVEIMPSGGKLRTKMYS